MSLLTFQSPKQRFTRRSYAVRGYIGHNGAGKTACAVWDLIPALERGIPVLSTARLLDYADPRPCEDEACEWPGHPDHGQAHPSWIPFTDWRQLFDFTERGGEVFLDEIAGAASSRQSGNLPFQVEAELQRLRHRGISLSYTAPAWARVEKVVREITQLMVHCSGLLPVSSTDDESATAWKRNRLLRWRAFDARELEKLTNSDVAIDKPKNGSARVHKPVVSQLFRIEESDAARAYNSLVNQTIRLGWAEESGMCLACGGRRSVPRCKCSTVDHDHGDE